MDLTPNADRAFFLQGRIDQALVDRLTPVIMKLHSESSGPITVYVDSLGGFISSGRKLFDLVKAPRLDGGKCSLIAVVTGTAASAAADFSALADYAILYPHSVMLYHGTRQESQQALTVADAQSLAESLRQTNETYALPLAQKSVERLILRLLSFPDRFHAFIQSPGSDFGALIHELRNELSSGASRLAESAIGRQRALQTLTIAVDAHMQQCDHPLGDNELEAEILIGILRAKLKAQESSTWLLSDGRLSELEADFLLLHDYHFGRQSSEVTRLSRLYGPTFLNDAEKAHYESQKQADLKAASEWLMDTTRPRLQPVWYFCVSLCRLLQDDDHWLSAYDAYWLGLADEVLGTQLPNMRELLAMPAADSPQT